MGQVNDRLGRLTEALTRVSLAPTPAILCRANGGPLPPAPLKSQAAPGGIAVEALSAAAGLRFIAIDKGRTCWTRRPGPPGRDAPGHGRRFDQVLVFTTVGDVRPENPGLLG